MPITEGELKKNLVRKRVKQDSEKERAEEGCSLR